MLKTETKSVIFYYLHYILMCSGLSSGTILLGVFIKQYSDASQGEIGIMLMTFPFMQIFAKPYFSYLADRYQAHRGVFIAMILTITVAFGSITIIPFFPNFYQNHARLSWWIMASNSAIGQCAIGSLCSLGDALAINAGTKANASFSRMRLSGTISWGVYGYIIGQINDVPSLPKYVPSFLILIASFVIEILMIATWSKEAFRMGDAVEKTRQLASSLPTDKTNLEHSNSELNKFQDPNQFRVNESLNQETPRKVSYIELELDRTYQAAESKAKNLEQPCTSTTDTRKQNLQLVLFKMIFKTDGRLIKYLILFTFVGFVTSPFNFVFMSYEDACKEHDGYNFSNLAGLVVTSQAAMETVIFFLLPCMKKWLTSVWSMIIVMLILTTRSLYYSFYYYTSGSSLYWAVIAEWGFGSTYALYTTLIADLSLMFASESEHFIGSLRRMGVLNDPKVVGREKSLTEEAEIRIALRATMQAVLGGAFDGLGVGLGNLASGLIYDHYGYIWLWKVMALLDLVILVALILVEFSGSKYSDLSYTDSKKLQLNKKSEVSVRAI